VLSKSTPSRWRFTLGSSLPSLTRSRPLNRALECGSYGINDLGQLAGTYASALGNDETLPGTAVRKARTWVMLSLGRLGSVGWRSESLRRRRRGLRDRHDVSLR